MRKSIPVFDFSEHEHWVDKEISKRFRASFMSNAKWRKCFTLINEVAGPHFQVIWKFVASPNRGVRFSLPSDQALDQTYLNAYFWFGPVYYKEIEWIEFPRFHKPYGMEKIPGSFIEQEIETVRAALIQVGSWQIEDTEEGFRLFGHK